MTGAAGGPHTVSHCPQEFIELRTYWILALGMNRVGFVPINRIPALVGQLDFYGALVFLDFLLIKHGGKEGAAEDV